MSSDNHSGSEGYKEYPDRENQQDDTSTATTHDTINFTIRPLYCQYGCGSVIKFKKDLITTTGKLIPLNSDGTYHDCNNSPYNKRKQSPIKCNYCGQEITFDKNIISKNGRKIPLNKDGSYHDCPQHPFNQAGH
jgi:hypothetical protein